MPDFDLSSAPAVPVNLAQNLSAAGMDQIPPSPSPISWSGPLTAPPENGQPGPPNQPVAGTPAQISTGGVPTGDTTPTPQFDLSSAPPVPAFDLASAPQVQPFDLSSAPPVPSGVTPTATPQPDSWGGEVKPPVSEGLIHHAARLWNNAQQATLDYTKVMEDRMDPALQSAWTEGVKDPTGAIVGATRMIPALGAMPVQAVSALGTALIAALKGQSADDYKQIINDAYARHQAIGDWANNQWDKLVGGEGAQQREAENPAAKAVGTALGLAFTEPVHGVSSGLQEMGMDKDMADKVAEMTVTGAMSGVVAGHAIDGGMVKDLGEGVRGLLAKKPKLNQDILNEINKVIPTDEVPSDVIKPNIKIKADQVPFEEVTPDTTVNRAPLLIKPPEDELPSHDVTPVEPSVRTPEEKQALQESSRDGNEPSLNGQAPEVGLDTRQEPNYAALGRATKQGGGIDPSITVSGWVSDLAKKAKDMGLKPHEIADAIYEKFKGTINPKEITKMQLNGTGDNPKEGSTRSTLMSPDDYLRFATHLDMEDATQKHGERISNIHTYVDTKNGINTVPTLGVSNLDGGVWKTIYHDGRHTALALKERGVTVMPVRIEDMTHGEFNRTNPKTLRTQNGEELATPRNMYPDQPKVTRNPFAGPGGKQGGAVDLSAFTPKEQADYERAVPILGRNRQTHEEFAATHPLGGPDTRFAIGANDGSFRTDTERNARWDQPDAAIHVGARVDDQIHLGKEGYERQIMEKVLPHWNNFRARYQLRVLPQEAYAGFLPFFRTFVKDVKIALDMEKHPETWFDGKNYSPTVEQMTKAGMDPKSAAAWSHYHQIWENVWPSLENFARDKGIDLPPRIPGYLPHFTQGAWVVRMLRDDPLSGKREYAASVGAKTAAQAAEFEKALNDHLRNNNPNGYHIEIQEPDIHNNLAPMIQGLFEVKDKIGQDARLSTLLQRLYEQSSLGYLQGALERAKSPQILHQLDRMGKNDAFTLTPRETFDAFGRLKTLMEAIPAMEMRSKFCGDVLFPLESGGYFEGRPNLTARVQEYVKQFMHIPDTSAGHLDNWVKDNFVRFGQDPGMPGKWVQAGNNFTAMSFLFYSPRFWIAGQLAQKIIGSNIVWKAKSDALNTKIPGADKLSVGKALLQDLIYSSRMIKLSNGESLHEYAQKTGHADPVYVENLDTSHVFNDPIAKWIDSYTRQGGFRLGYLLYRQIMTEQDALNAAGKFTDNVNVPYAGDTGKPVLFSKEGEYFKTSFTFMQYWMHQLQQGYSYVPTLVNSSGNLKARAYAVTGLAHGLATMVAVGGVMGLPFAQTANTIINWINEKFGTDYPTPKEMVRNLGNLMRNTDWGSPYANLVTKIGEFGVLSSVLKYDVSSSASGPNISLPGEVVLSVFHTLVTAGILTLQWALKPGGVTSKEAAEEILNKVPPPLRGATEYILRNKSMEDVWNYVTGKETDMAPSKYNIDFPSGYERTQLDSILRLVGLKSVGEAAVDTTQTIDAKHMKVEEIVTDTLIQQIVSHPNGPHTAEYAMQLAQHYGVNVQTVLDQINKYQEERNMTETQRRVTNMKPDDLTSIMHMQRWLKENASTPQ